MSKYSDDFQSYSEYTETVLKFTRTSILASITDLAWEAWRNKSKDFSAKEGQQKLLVSALAGRVAAIGAAKCSELGYREATKADAYNVIHEYLGIEESFFADNGKKESEELNAAVDQSNEFRKYSREDVIRTCQIRLFTQRLMRLEWESLSFNSHSIGRSWAVLSELLLIRPDIEQKICRLLNVEPLISYRCGYGLLALASNPGPGTLPGRLNVRTSTMSDEKLKSQLDLDMDTLRQVAMRWSWPCEDFKGWHDQIIKDVDPLYVKYIPSPLKTAPLIRLDKSFKGVSELNSNYLLPSPWDLVWKMRNHCFERWEEVFDDKELVDRAKSDVGVALENYCFKAFSEICGKSNVFRVSDLLKESVVRTSKPKEADLVIVEDDIALVVEVKRSVGGQGAKSLATPKEVVEMWEERLLDPYKQCAHTISRLRSCGDLKNIKKFFSIVCIDDFLMFEGSIFSLFAYGSGLQKDLGLETIEVMEVAQLEKLLCSLGPKRASIAIEKKWMEINAAKSLTDTSFDTRYLERVERPATPYGVNSVLGKYSDEIL